MKTCILIAFLAAAPFAVQAQEEHPDQSISLPVRPNGIYEFLSGLSPSPEQETKIRSELPYTKIELQQWAQPNLSTLKPGPEYEITFHADGHATYAGNETSKRSGLHFGRISLDQYARLCLLLERIEIDKQDTILGVQAHVSHPVVCDLRVKSRSRSDMIEFRNDNAFGDFRFWIVQSLIEKTAADIDWQPAKRK